MSIKLKWIAVGIIAIAVLGVLTLVSGIIPIRASDGHWAVTRWLLNFAKERSVATHALGVEVPPLTDRMVRIGAGHYEVGCRYCHGSPGIRMPVVPGESTPRPPPLYDSAHRYTEAELFEIVLHGIKFTGMPGWPTLVREDEVWAMVAFLQIYGTMDHEQYQEMVFGPMERADQEAPFVVRLRCARCHGDDGLSAGYDAFPRLAGQPEAYLLDTLRAYASGTRHSGIMEPLAAELSDAELKRAARWYASRPPSPVQPAASPAVQDPGLDQGRIIAMQGLPDRNIPACQECHSGTEHPEYPRLVGQWAPYIEEQLELWYADRRGGGQYFEVMQTVAAHQLKPEEARAVAAFFAQASADQLR